MSRQRCGQRQGQARVGSRSDTACDQVHPVLGQRAGLVEDDGVHRGTGFQRLQAAHQYALPGQGARGGQRSGRGRERQGTRASDDQHRDGHALGVARVGGPPPGRCRCGGEHDPYQEGAGDAVGDLRQPRLFHGGLLHQRDNARVAGLAAGAFHLHQHHAGQVVAAGDHRLALAPKQRLGLAGQQRLVDAARAGHDAAVGRKHLARQHPDQVAGSQAAHWHPLERAVVAALALYRLRQAPHQRFERTGRTVAQPLLQQPPRQQEEHEHRDRVVPDLVAQEPVRIESHGRAGAECNGDAQRDRHVHSEAPVAQVARCGREERPTGKQHHRQREHPGCPAQQRLDVGRDLAGCGHVRRHGVHHHLHHAEPGDQPAPQHQALRLQPRHCGHQVTRRNGAVAGALQRCQPMGRAAALGRPNQSRSRTRPVDAHTVHAGQLRQRRLHRE
jgi:hypothetical protein